MKNTIPTLAVLGSLLSTGIPAQEQEENLICIPNGKSGDLCPKIMECVEGTENSYTQCLEHVSQGVVNKKIIEISISNETGQCPADFNYQQVPLT